MSTPEHFEGAIEGCELILPVHEQRAARVIHLVPRSQVDVLQGLGDVDDPPDVDVDAEPSKQTPEDDQVVRQLGHAGTL
jgi:hypothetical protein